MSGAGLLLAKFRRGLEERRDLSPGELLRRIWRAGMAMRGTGSRLAACDAVGARARIVGRAPLIENRGTLTIGDDLTLNCDVVPVHLVVEPGASLAIGDGVSLNFGVVITSRSSVRLGDRVRVGPYGIIADTDVPLAGLDASRVAAMIEAAPIEIGRDVWLGGRVTVLAGARIGDGSVIGAGSVVSGDVPAGVIASGNPLRVLRSLPAAPRG